MPKRNKNSTSNNKSPQQNTNDDNNDQSNNSNDDDNNNNNNVSVTIMTSPTALPPSLSAFRANHATTTADDADTVQSCASMSTLTGSLSENHLPSSNENEQQLSPKFPVPVTHHHDYSIVDTPFCSPDPPPRPNHANNNQEAHQQRNDKTENRSNNSEIQHNNTSDLLVSSRDGSIDDFDNHFISTATPEHFMMMTPAALASKEEEEKEEEGEKLEKQDNVLDEEFEEFEEDQEEAEEDDENSQANDFANDDDDENDDTEEPGRYFYESSSSTNVQNNNNNNYSSFFNLDNSNNNSGPFSPSRFNNNNLSASSSMLLHPSSSSFPATHHHLPSIIRRNVFFESGVETGVDNPFLHFMHVGQWYTKSCDYYQHRRPADGELRSQVVVWLHNARPRNAFVFLIHSVENGTPEGTMLDKFKELLYGVAPRFGIVGRAEAKDGTRKKRISGRPVGVEVVEVPHQFITAIDYSPGLVSTRFALEASQVTCTWYESEEAARMAYCCSLLTETMKQQQQQQQQVEASLFTSPPFLNSSNSNGKDFSHLLPLSERAESIIAATIGESVKKSTAFENAATSAAAAPHHHHHPFLMMNLNSAAAYASSSSGHNDANKSNKSKKNRRITIHHQRQNAATEGRRDDHQQVGEEEGQDDEGQSCDSVSEGSKETNTSSALMTKKSLKLSSNNKKKIHHHQKKKVIKEESSSLTPLEIPRAIVPSSIMSSRTESTSSAPAPVPLSSSSSVVYLSKNTESSSILPQQSSSDSSTIDNNSLLDSNEPRTINNTMIVCFTQDPNFNAVLREIVLPGGSPTNEGLGTHDFTDSVVERQRLLRLVEAGIPSWAVFCCRYGIFYHRYLRILVGWAVNLWPLIALALGLYDLYSHMPYVHQYLVPLFSLFEDSWIFRLSLGIAYIFSYFLYFFQGLFLYVSYALSFLSVAVVPIYPVIEFFYPLYSFLYLVVAGGASFVVQLFHLVFGSVGALLVGVVRALFYPFVSILSLAPTTAATTGAAASTMPQFITWFVVFWSTVLRPLKNLGMAIYNNIIHAGSLIARHEASLRMWYMRKFNRLRRWIMSHAALYWKVYLIAIGIFVILYFGPGLIGYIFGVTEEK